MTQLGHRHSIAAQRELDNSDAGGLICRPLARAHEGEPVIDRFDIKTCGRSERVGDGIQFVPRNHVFDPNEAVWRALFYQSHGGLRPKAAIAQETPPHLEGVKFGRRWRKIANAPPDGSCHDSEILQARDFGRRDNVLGLRQLGNVVAYVLQRAARFEERTSPMSWSNWLPTGALTV
jgi:hypothetical protein